jgi:predicted negative regulator of RcsB-dependent stress response
MTLKNTQEEKINITKEKFIYFLQKNKKYIILFIIFFILLAVGLLASYSVKKQNNIKLSVDFYKEINSLDEAENLKKYYQENKSKKVSSLIALNYANSLVENNNIKQAIEIYDDITKNKSYDNFIRDFADFMKLKAMISSDYKKFNKEITDLIEISKNKENHNLKYYIFEQEAIFLFLNNNKEQSYQAFLTLSDKLNIEIPQQIKMRAKLMVRYYKKKL